MQNDAWQTREILSTSVQSCRLCLHCHLHMINNLTTWANSYWSPPCQVVNLVCVLPLSHLCIFKGLICEDLHSLATSCLILARLSHRVELTNLVLQGECACMYMSVSFSYDTCSLSLRPLIPSSSFYLLFRTQRTHAQNAIKWVGDPPLLCELKPR